MSSKWEAGFQFLTENSIDVICRARRNMVLSYVSPSSLHVLGWSPSEMVGQRCDAFFISEDSSPFSAHVSALDSSPFTVRIRMKNGGLAWVEIRYRVLSNLEIAEAGEIVIIIRDISERKSLMEKLAAFEGNDARTGLSTTRALEEALDREWSRMAREGSQLSLLLLDFNGFRQFHSGSSTHFEGDRCLAEIAAAIHPVLRLTDAAAHYRAEQIAILLSSTGAYGAATVAAKVRAAIHRLCAQHPLQADHCLEDRNETAVYIGIASTRARSAAPNRMPELFLLAAQSALHKAIEGNVSQGLKARDMASAVGPTEVGP